MLVHDIAFVDDPGAKIGLHHRLRSHDVPETPLHLGVCSAEKLIEAVGLHVGHVCPEGQARHVRRDIVMPDEILVDRLHLGLAPVQLRDLLEPRQAAALEADHAAVVDVGDHLAALFVPDRVPGGKAEVLVLRVGHQLAGRIDACPAVEDLQAEKAVGHDRIEIERLAHVVLPLDQDDPGSASVEPRPVHALQEPVPELRLALQAPQLVDVLRVDGRLNLVPLPQRVVRDQLHDVLDDPVLAVQRGQQLVVLCHAGRDVLRGLHEVKGPEAEPCGGVREGVHHCSVFLTSAHAAVFLQSGRTVLL